MLAGIVGLAVGALFLVGPAFAEEADVYAQASSAQQRVEESAALYEQAQQVLEQVEAEIAANEERIAELAAQIPEQQVKSNQAFKSLYRMQREGGSLFELLLSSGSLNEFLVRIDYMTALYEDKMKAINQLKSMKSELDEIAAGLSEKRAQAAAGAEAAQEALVEAQALREAAQAAAEAARQAEAEAAAAAAAAAAEEEAAREAAGDEGPREEGDLTPGEVVADPGSDGADWTSDKDEFVSSWSGRIDAYLAGSPLAGQGATFAAAAWDYGVDPRFSPAISCVESSKGLYCFRSHNAWGWGSVDWDSWEEAIASHVRGLARGYGYTVTVEGARKYCPPNWEFWYSRVCAEMAKI